MILILLYYVLAAANVLVWYPVLRQFYGQWKARRNHLSLAICAVIFIVMGEGVALGFFWLAVGSIDPTSAAFALTGLWVVTGGLFHYFRRLSRDFPDQRRPQD